MPQFSPVARLSPGRRRGPERGAAGDLL